MTFIAVFFDSDTQLAIFNYPAFQDIGSPMRGYLLMGCLLFSTLVMIKTKNQHNGILAKSIFSCSGTFFLSTVIAAVFGSGLIPAGLNLDFYRWFIFPFQIGVIACALLSGYVLLRSIDKKVAIVWSVIFLILPILVFVTDTIKIKKIIDGDAVSLSQIQGMQNIFVSGLSGCSIVSPNSVVIENLTYVQKYRTLEYAEMLTNCRMLAGSWVHAPSDGWRESNGLPSKGIFNTVRTGMNLFFVGTRAELGEYGRISSWNEVGILPKEQIPIWKLKMVENEKPS